jgi:hypothetical protein
MNIAGSILRFSGQGDEPYRASEAIQSPTPKSQLENLQERWGSPVGTWKVTTYADSSAGFGMVPPSPQLIGFYEGHVADVVATTTPQAIRGLFVEKLDVKTAIPTAPETDSLKVSLKTGSNVNPTASDWNLWLNSAPSKHFSNVSYEGNNPYSSTLNVVV